MGRFFFKAEKEFKLHLVIVLIGRKINSLLSDSFRFQTANQRECEGPVNEELAAGL